MATLIPSAAMGAARAARAKDEPAGAGAAAAEAGAAAGAGGEARAKAGAAEAGARAAPGRHGPGWGRIFLGGLALWVATVVVTFATRNPNLVPTVILVGSFLVPVTFVAYAFQRADEVVSAQRIFTAFVYGGVLGILGASLLEAEFLKQPNAGAYGYVGLIEEAVKLAALWLIARHLPRYTMRDGMVLGAAVGFGFAALESAGYAFNALFTTNGLSLMNLVETELLRGILAPVGHGLWTAILGGALFATAARHGRPRLTGSVIGWYLVVAILHGLWDSSRSIAVYLTLLLTGTQIQWLMIQFGRVPVPTETQLHLFTALNWTLLVIDALAGLLILRRRWRRATALSPVAEPAPESGGGAGSGAAAPGPRPGAGA
jgi:protease PrsW